MNDAHEEEFRKQGYSKESLKMLESKEGQLNAIYACFGSVVAESQFFEDAVKRLFTTVRTRPKINVTSRVHFWGRIS